MQKALWWEKDYVDFRSLGGVGLSTKVRVAGLQLVLCPDGVQEHIAHTVDQHLAWDQLRDEIRRVLIAKETMLKGDGVTGMEVGATQKTDADKGHPTAKGDCYRCGRSGYIARNCECKKAYEKHKEDKPDAAASFPIAGWRPKFAGKSRGQGS